MTKLTGRHGLPLLSGAALALLLSGCGSNPSAGDAVSAHTSHQPTVHTSTTASASGSGSSSAGSTPSSGSADSGPTQCMTSQLSAELGPGDGAAGSSYYQVVLTNTGDQPCRTGGFGGVSFVGGSGGAQIGAAAVREQKGRARSFVLQPGAKAGATLQESEAGNYDAGSCHPTAVAGLRIYPPNNTESLFVKQHGATGCKNAKIQLLFLRPYQPVR